jgi:hypothetical protein
VPANGPRILLCTRGSALVRAAGGSESLSPGGGGSLSPGGGERAVARGQAIWLAADDRDVTVVPQDADTQLFLASDGLDV